MPESCTKLQRQFIQRQARWRRSQINCWRDLAIPVACNPRSCWRVLSLWRPNQSQGQAVEWAKLELMPIRELWARCQLINMNMNKCRRLISIQMGALLFSFCCFSPSTVIYAQEACCSFSPSRHQQTNSLSLLRPLGLQM